jgi:hypothetical protein
MRCVGTGDDEPPMIDKQIEPGSYGAGVAEQDQPPSTLAGLLLQGLYDFLSAIAQWLRAFASLMAGIVIGTGFTVLILNVGGDFWETSVWIGATAGITAFVLFVLVRILLTHSINVVGKKSIGPGPLAAFISRFANAFFPGNEAQRQAVDEIAEATPRLANAAFSFLSATLAASAAVGLAVAIAGTVVSMATVVATFHQVERMDRQNKLIEQQIAEAKATRVSSVFAAQLPALLGEIDRARPAESSTPWRVSPALVARIQALIYATQPYAVDEEIDVWRASAVQEAGSAEAGTGEAASGPPGHEQRACVRAFPAEGAAQSQPRLFSPERGQLLVLLIAARFPFERLPNPLDFSASDLRNLRLRNSELGPVPLVDLGETILKGSNLRNADLSNVDLSRTDLSAAILPPLTTSTRLIALPSRFLGQSRGHYWLTGANLEAAVVDLRDAGGSTTSGGSNPGSSPGSWDDESEEFRESVWIPGELKTGPQARDTVRLSELLPVRYCRKFAVIHSTGRLTALAAAVTRLLPEATSAALSNPLPCNTRQLPALQHVRQLVGREMKPLFPVSSDTPLQRFAWVVLSDLDRDLADCVFREGRFANSD